MMRTSRLRGVSSGVLLTAIALGCAVKIQPPDSPTPRTLDPRLPSEGTQPVAASPDALRLRLLDTHSALPASFSVLRRSSEGELTEDPVWSWSVTPAALFDRALRLTAADDSEVELVDRSTVPTAAAKLLSLHLESGSGQATELFGAVELTVTETNGTVRTVVLDASASAADELPGNLADETGRLLTRLATMCWEAVKRGSE
jgi:hypothetical protein